VDIFKIVAVGILSAAVIVTVKLVKPELAVLLTAAASVILLIMTVNALTDVIAAFAQIGEKTGLAGGLFSGVLKIVGVGYITEFAANVCEDAGTKSVGDKILLGGKVTILVLALPIVTSLIEIIIDILP